MQRAEQDLRVIAQRIGELLMHATDLGLSRQEHQHAAGLVVQGFEDGLHQARLDEFTGLERPAPAHRHRVHAPFAAQDRRVVEQPGQAFAFKRGGHQENFQRLIVTEQFATIEAQGQGQVSVEAALVKLVENQQAHAFQRRIILQAPGEDAFGDHFDSGIGADFAVEANAIAHGFADLFPQLTGQPLRRRACGQSAGFEHQDGLPGQPRFVEQGQRHAGGFTGAGRRFEHGFVACSEGFTQGG
ncbi:hypothetical protein D3C81_1463540 [compost metagenome]